MSAVLDYRLKKAFSILNGIKDTPNSPPLPIWSVLTVFILHANSRRRCYPSMETIAEMATNGNLKKASECKKWLIKHGAIVLVPYKKRVGDEKKLAPNKHVFQLTGCFVWEGTVHPYFYMNDNDWEELNSALEELGVPNVYAATGFDGQDDYSNEEKSEVFSNFFNGEKVDGENVDGENVDGEKRSISNLEDYPSKSKTTPSSGGGGGDSSLRKRKNPPPKKGFRPKPSDEDSDQNQDDSEFPNVAPSVRPMIRQVLAIWKMDKKHWMVAKKIAELLLGLTANAKGEWKEYVLPEPLDTFSLNEWAKWYRRKNLAFPQRPSAIYASIAEWKAEKASKPLGGLRQVETVTTKRFVTGFVPGLEDDDDDEY